MYREIQWFLFYVDELKLRKIDNFDPMWKCIDKEIHLEDSTPLLHHVYLGCIQRVAAVDKCRYPNQERLVRTNSSILCDGSFRKAA